MQIIYLSHFLKFELIKLCSNVSKELKIFKNKNSNLRSIVRQKDDGLNSVSCVSYIHGRKLLEVS